MYDLIIKNGVVIDPENNFLGVKTIYVKNGKFVERDADSSDSALRTIDATGCYVTPGLIDAHIHVFEGGSQLGGKADLICPASGVTTCIDAGSAGLFNFKNFYEHNIICSTTTIKAAIEPSRYGVQIPPEEENLSPDLATLDVLLPYFEKYHDTLVGIKSRVHKGVTGRYGLKTLESSVKTAQQLRDRGFTCQIMVHFGDLASDISISSILDLLGPNDVFTHIYRSGTGVMIFDEQGLPLESNQEESTTIFDENGKVLDCVKKARKRGVIFESGGARMHCSFESLRKGIADRFLPQIISTDMTGKAYYLKPSGWMVLKMAFYYNFGMSIEDIIRASTYTPAQVYHMTNYAGTLGVGKPADIAILKAVDKPRVIKDHFGNQIELEKLLVPMATIKNGIPVFQQVYL